MPLVAMAVIVVESFSQIAVSGETDKEGPPASEIDKVPEEDEHPAASTTVRV